MHEIFKYGYVLIESSFKNILGDVVPRIFLQCKTLFQAFLKNIKNLKINPSFCWAVGWL